MATIDVSEITTQSFSEIGEDILYFIDSLTGKNPITGDAMVIADTILNGIRDGSNYIAS